MTSKRQQTMAKVAREREVKERRARKLEKKHAAAAERRAKAEGATSSTGGETYAGPASQP
jgi:cell division protein FtsB